MCTEALKSGRVPDDWKMAEAVPLYKGKKKKEVKVIARTNGGMSP